MRLIYRRSPASKRALEYPMRHLWPTHRRPSLHPMRQTAGLLGHIDGHIMTRKGLRIEAVTAVDVAEVDSGVIVAIAVSGASVVAAVDSVVERVNSVTGRVGSVVEKVNSVPEMANSAAEEVNSVAEGANSVAERVAIAMARMVASAAVKAMVPAVVASVAVKATVPVVVASVAVKVIVPVVVSSGAAKVVVVRRISGAAKVVADIAVAVKAIEASCAHIL